MHSTTGGGGEEASSDEEEEEEVDEAVTREETAEQPVTTETTQVKFLYKYFTTSEKKLISLYHNHKEGRNLLQTNEGITFLLTCSSAPTSSGYTF